MSYLEFTVLLYLIISYRVYSRIFDHSPIKFKNGKKALSAKDNKKMNLNI